MNQPDDERPPLVLAMQWVSRLTSIAVEMVLPALLGHWADQWVGTAPVLLLLGAAFGLTGGMWHLIRLTQTTEPKRREEQAPQDEKPEP